MAARRLLLLSSSTVHPSGFLEYAKGNIQSFLGSQIKKVLFIPYALHDHDAYEKKVQVPFKEIGYTIHSIHHEKNPADAVSNAEAIFIGGGNTFRLLNSLYKYNLIESIRNRVVIFGPTGCSSKIDIFEDSGMPYMGSSAGTNVATLSIKTTNDMPIVYPPSFDALKLVPFQINPHFLDADPSSTHKGETREERLREFHEENDTPVLGLREGAILHREGDKLTLIGTTVGAVLFEKNQVPKQFQTNSDLTFLLKQ